MVKNCLALLGLIVLVLMTSVGLLLGLAYIDLDSLQDLTSMPLVVNGTPVSVTDLDALEGWVPSGIALEGLVPGTTNIEQINPLPLPPLPTPLPTPTPTQVPPLDPYVYRTEVMIRARSLASGLDAFFAANDKLGKDNGLFNDQPWQNEMQAALDSVASGGRALDEVGPPPAEYQSIDVWLERAGKEAQQLRENYLLGLRTGETQHFTTASENLTRLTEYLRQAELEMIQAGWSQS